MQYNMAMLRGRVSVVPVGDWLLVVKPCWWRADAPPELYAAVERVPPVADGLPNPVDSALFLKVVE